MNASKSQNELLDLFDSLFGGAITPPEHERLQKLLADDPAARRIYFDYLDMHLHLRQWRKAEAAAEQRGEERGARDQRRGMAGSPAIDVSVDLESQIPEPPFPTLSTTNYPPPTAPFVGSWAFSYMVATVIMGVAILGFWAYKITHYQHIAEAPSQSAPSKAMQEMVFVGRITGMVDVKWSDDPRYLPPPGYAHVPLGREYILDSGLLEITYDSGAKVILQGPCTYEVESTAGGYLALGKLTAKVVSGQWPVASAKPQAANQKSSSSFILHPSSLFSVRTPTAVVTDLGTEFGVEVSGEGNTTSRVFRGKVKVLVLGGTASSPSSGREVILRENESARVEKDEGTGGLRLVLDGAVDNPPKFARRMVKALDLLDVVAGGYGMGRRRGHGISPADGMGDPVFVTGSRGGDHQYRLVDWHKFIDGVFVPDGRAGSVQLDSAGHAFNGFPHTTGVAWNSIWAQATWIAPGGRATSGERLIGRNEQYMPDGRGLLILHSNAGITFDLEAVRRAYPDIVPSRFHTLAGMADAKALHAPASARADVWVFVDGRLKLERTGLCARDGPVEVDVELGPDDRFLTLVSTDGGNECYSDWIVLGDPVLHMAPAGPEKPNKQGVRNAPNENQKKEEPSMGMQ